MLIESIYFDAHGLLKIDIKTNFGRLPLLHPFDSLRCGTEFLLPHAVSQHVLPLLHTICSLCAIANIRGFFRSMSRSNLMSTPCAMCRHWEQIASRCLRCPHSKCLLVVSWDPIETFHCHCRMLMPPKPIASGFCCSGIDNMPSENGPKIGEFHCRLPISGVHGPDELVAVS